MIEPFYVPVPNLHLKTSSPDAYLSHLEFVQHHSEAPPSSGFQPVANMISEAQTHASFTPPIY
ncbi:hypothetical protein ZOSMA_57G00560 [Zostera marina]|uniref:Uncharacterized protein n=1 Tax=Zostera marina TaxID=29655 RepID=A0A0K9NXR3_ZOSMR|nr:hypothetical protein ZOSMA_57G00560 [Zostera marina]